jgi:hypothetical protein
MPPPATVAPRVQAATQSSGEGYATQHSGRNWSQAAVAVNMTTPILRIINVENHASPTSSLTMLHAASTASAAAMPSELDSFTLFPSSSSFDEDALPSPKRDNLSDFNRKLSDNDLVASSNDSATWEKEDKRMRHVILAQVQAKDADDISENDGPVNEVEEFMRICGEGEQVVNDNPLPINVP